MDRIPYTYRIGWSALNLHYYGVRFRKGCGPDDLWVKYFTSSRIVKQLRDTHGEPDIIEVRKTFTTIDSARKWEREVLLRLNVLSSVKWLNKAIDSPNFVTGSGVLSPNWGKKFSESTRQKHSTLRKTHRWWNNGKVDAFCPIPPDETYVAGRLPFNNRGAAMGSEVQRNKFWVNNGTVECMISKEDSISVGFVIGRLPGKLKGPKNPIKGGLWWTDGEQTKMAQESPGPTWRRGRRLSSGRAFYRK